MAKVMVVDDARADLTLMESILTSLGHQVITLPGGARLYSIARATEDSFSPNPAWLCTCSARPM